MNKEFDKMTPEEKEAWHKKEDKKAAILLGCSIGWIIFWCVLSVILDAVYSIDKQTCNIIGGIGLAPLAFLFFGSFFIAILTVVWGWVCSLYHKIKELIIDLINR